MGRGSLYPFLRPYNAASTDHAEKAMVTAVRSAPLGPEGSALASPSSGAEE